MENQHSKGVHITGKYNYSRAKGKYISLCEGDDYWIDPYKLQKQVDYMESHPECTFCFTNGKVVDVTGKQKERVFVPELEENGVYFYDRNHVYEAGELALLGFVPTATFLYPRRILDDLPDFYYRRFAAGDLKL